MPTSPLKRGFKELLAEANAVIESISVQDLPYLLDDPDVALVDVRDANERDQEGHIPASIHAPRGLLEFHADPDSPIYNPSIRQDMHLVLYCGTGGRSALAAKTLIDMGFKQVSSLAGGVAAWKAAGNRLESL